MGAKPKSYTPQYRSDAAHLVIDTGRTIAAVAEEIGVGAQLLGRWIAQERARMDDPPEALDVNERAEVERLRTEVAALRMDRDFLKKSSGLLRSRSGADPDQAFTMIAAKKAEPDNQIPLARMCQLLGVSRSGHHAWVARQNAEPGPRARRRAELAAKVITAHAASDGTYGSPGVLAELRAGGEQVSRKTIAKIMPDHDIHGISPRPFTPVTTTSDARPCRIPDLVERRFDTGTLNRV